MQELMQLMDYQGFTIQITGESQSQIAVKPPFQKGQLLTLWLNKNNMIMAGRVNKENKMLTERTLKLWRKEALINEGAKEGVLTLYTNTRSELARRILRMTQELLDAHLIRSGQVNSDKA